MSTLRTTPPLLAALATLAACSGTPARRPVPPPPAPLPAPARPAPAAPAPAPPAATPAPAPPAGVALPEPPALVREFRGVWVASVDNIDWPSRRDLTSDEQRRELVAILDRARELGLNAVLLQVRPAADALYPSALEPWSEYLTGLQGRAPSPAWDPLAFAVREAHARGLELHAWLNPYRAKHPSATGPLDPSHVAVRQPQGVWRYGSYLWMDPGDSAGVAQSMAVIEDIVRRYDVDGIHVDDYFYPYEERDRAGRVIPFPDSLTTYARYVARGGTLAIGDWRRANVDAWVRGMYERTKAIKPWVKVGISPFGIWRPGFPADVRGFDSYDKLYGDSRKWLREGWLDYATPQLYWPIAKEGQRYPSLLAWWAGENVQGRHLWPGNYTSRTGGTGWPASELVDQVRLTRQQRGATGNVHFSMAAFLPPRPDRRTGELRPRPALDTLARTLAGETYAARALVPASPWLARPGDVLAAPTVDAAPNATLAVRLPPGAAARVVVAQCWTGSGWRTVHVPLADPALPVVTLPPGTTTGILGAWLSWIDRTGRESPRTPWRAGVVSGR